MRRRGVTAIVPPDEILNSNIDPWNLISVVRETSDKDSAVNCCARWGLIKNSVRCNKCLEICTLQKYKQGIDGNRWACSACGAKKSVREGSFFSRSKMDLVQILVLIYMWCNQCSKNTIAQEAGITDKKVVICWISFMRDECTRWFCTQYDGIGGTDEEGNAIIVEIDRPKFFTRRNDQALEGHWIFGGVERETKRCFLVEVPNPNVETLKANISQFILPGSYIITYESLSDIESMNDGVYQCSVADPDDSFAHACYVEEMWCRIEPKLINQFATGQGVCASYLHELMFRDFHFEEDPFYSFAATLRDNYQNQCDIADSFNEA